MSRSFVRRIATVGFGLLLGASTLGLWGCAHVDTNVDTKEKATVRFAVSSRSADAAMEPAVRVGEVRVLSMQVNTQEPVAVEVAGSDLIVTFATRQRDGVSVALDTTSLETLDTTPYSYAPHAKHEAPPLTPLRARVGLGRGGSLSCWTDEASGRSFAQAFDAEGAPRGERIVVSPRAMTVVGPSHAATVDGRHVVVTFFVHTARGFELVAASLEAR